MIMGSRSRHAGVSAHKPMIIAQVVVAVAVIVVGTVTAIQRGDDAVGTHRNVAASLGMISGGPDHAGATAAEQAFAGLVNLPRAQPAHCGVLQQVRLIRPDIWFSRTPLSVFLRSPDASETAQVESDLNASAIVAFWIYEPPRAALAEERSRSTCNADFSANLFPPAFRVALKQTDQTAADQLAATLSHVGSIDNISCLVCSQIDIKPDPAPGRMEP